MAVVDEGGLSSLGRRIQSQSGVPPPTSFSRSRRRFPHCFLFSPMTRGTPYTIRATLAARRVIDTSVSLPPLPARPLPRRPRRRAASATSRAACSSRPSPPARSPSSSTTRCCAREVEEWGGVTGAGTAHEQSQNNEQSDRRRQQTTARPHMMTIIRHEVALQDPARGKSTRPKYPAQQSTRPKYTAPAGYFGEVPGPEKGTKTCL